jgi:large subunit ribosomal protein L17
MLANMACSLILHKRISTTTAKAKALRSYVEPLITKAKDDNTHSRRMVFSYLKNKGAVAELFRDVAEKVGERPGGYTRILKTGSRLGDNAEMCFVELVDYNESYTSTETKQTGSSRRRRRRRGGKKKTQEQPAPTATESPAEETPEEQQSPDSKEDQTKSAAKEQLSPEETEVRTDESGGKEGKKNQQQGEDTAKAQDKNGGEKKNEDDKKQDNESEKKKK